MKRTIETAAWLAVIAAVTSAFVLGTFAAAMWLLVAAGLAITRCAIADDDGYEQTVFGREAADFDRIIANGGID